RIIRHIESEESLEAAVPGVRKIGNRQVSGQQRQFQLKPQGDVQVVRRLVRFHANQARPHVVRCEEEIIELRVGEGSRESLLQSGEEMLPERQTATDLILPQPRLRLVDAERTGAAERRAEV